MKVLLRTFLVLALVTASITQVQAETEYPILGYFKMGMSYEDFSEQLQKLREATEMRDQFRTVNYIGIGGVNFDITPHVSSVINDEFSIDDGIYEKYDKKYSPTFFATNTVFVPDSIDYTKEYTQHLAAFKIASAPLELGDMIYQGIPSDDKKEDVLEYEKHNKLVARLDTLCQYLSKRYGQPTQTYDIPLMSEKKAGALHNPINAVQLYTIMTEPYAPGSYHFMPKAVWKDGNTEIIIGIDTYNGGSICLSFIDTQLLSHSHLDSILVKHTGPKANIQW